ncbi:MAG: CatB-related O-acetyltransferase [Eubacterium sp.]
MISINFKSQDEYYYLPGPQSEKFYGIFVGRGTYAGGLSIRSSLSEEWDKKCFNLQIGRYTSIGHDVRLIMDMNHDYKSVYQGLIPEFASDVGGKEGLGQNLKNLPHRGQILIGNDVWIGDNVTILGGNIIGDGAVVATGAIVTKDVPPYAIVAGNPAHVIKYRFEEEIVRKLQRIHWWSWSPDQLKAAEEDMKGDIRKFVDKYYGNVEEPEEEIRFSRILDDSKPCMLFFLDVNYPDALWKKVIGEFVQTYSHGDAELVLAYDVSKENADTQIQEVLTMLEALPDSDAVINILGYAGEEDRLIRQMNYYITNRTERTLERTACAWRNDVKLLSGVDAPIF